MFHALLLFAGGDAADYYGEEVEEETLAEPEEEWPADDEDDAEIMASEQPEDLEGTPWIGESALFMF